MKLPTFNIKKPSTDVDLARVSKLQGLDVQILCKDQLNDSFHGLAIVNLDDYSGEGTHWCGLVWDQVSKTGIWFDSYGGFPVFLAEKLSSGGSLYYSDKQLQKLGENICGWFVLAFFQDVICNEMPFTKWINQFYHTSELSRLKNNKLVSKILSKYINLE